MLLDIRLPRLLLGVFVGAALAVSGAMMQGMFRNPLADPGLIGVSSGAALAAVATIALGNGLAAPLDQGVRRLRACRLRPSSAASSTTLVLVAIVGRQGQLAVGTLLLAGIAIGALSGALTGLIAYASDDRELRDLTLWMLGSLSGASWPKVLAVLPFALLIGAGAAAAGAGAERPAAGRGRGVSSGHRRRAGQARHHPGHGRGRRGGGGGRRRGRLRRHRHSRT